MKKIFWLAAAGMLASGSSFAGYTPSFDGGQFVATVTAPGGSLSTSEPILIGTRQTGAIGVLVARVNAARSSLQQAVLAEVNNAAASSGGTITIYPAIHGTITASLTGLTGAYTGYNQLAFGGATTSTQISSSMSKYGISATCTTSVTFSNVQFAATYNPANGQVLNDPAVTYANLNPSTFVSCTTNHDWVPFLGTMVDHFLASKINSALQSSFVAVDQSIVSAIFPTATAQIGITTVLKPGKFVIGGVDWGAYIDNNFATLFTGKSLTVSMAEYLPPTGSTNSVRQPVDQTVDTKTLVVDLSDGSRTLKLSIDDVEDFTWVYTCTTPQCTKPL